MSFDPRYVDPPKLNIPNIPNMGSMFQSYFINTSQSINDIKNEIAALKSENESLKEEIKNLQSGRFVSVFVPIITVIVSLAGLIIPFIKS